MERARPRQGTRIVRLSDNKQVDLARETFVHSLGEAWTAGLIGATAGLKAK